VDIYLVHNEVDIHNHGRRRRYVELTGASSTLALQATTETVTAADGVIPPAPATQDAPAALSWPA
jgi:hypothetical protein